MPPALHKGQLSDSGQSCRRRLVLACSAASSDSVRITRNGLVVTTRVGAYTYLVQLEEISQAPEHRTAEC